MMSDAKAPEGARPKTTAELFADRYRQQFTEVRDGGLFGPGFGRDVPEPEPDLEAE